jgi:hypothetical protein
MAEKRKKAAKRSEEAKTDTIEEWLRMIDSPVTWKEGDGRRKRKERGGKKRGKR